MAGADRAAAEPEPGRSSAGQEQGQTEARSTTPQMGDSHQDGAATPAPPLPPRPLPVPYGNTQGKSLPHPLPPPSALLPSHEGSGFEAPDSPRWHVLKIIFGLLSLVVSAVIFGIGITIGVHNAPYYDMDDYWVPADIEFGTSGAAAGLAILLTTAEFLTICLSSTRRGMHPGVLVTFHLLVWLIALAAVVLTALFSSDYSYYYYSYPRSEETELGMQNTIYEQVLLGFDCTLLFIHFILFVRACVETNRLALARKKPLVIRVPVYGGPEPGAQGVYYPPQSMGQAPPQFLQGNGPMSPQTAHLYGGYYAPAPPPMAWTGPQQQGQHAMLQGYHAPSSSPAITVSAPAQSSRREPSAAAVASGSGSRPLQGQAQPQPPSQSLPHSPESQ